MPITTFDEVQHDVIVSIELNTSKYTVILSDDVSFRKTISLQEYQHKRGKSKVKYSTYRLQ